MRPFLLTLPPALSPRRGAARSVAALHAHAEVVRLVVLIVLAFFLAFYLDSRDANAYGPPTPGIEAALTPTAPALRPPAGSAR